jgi:hypothetical protein
MTRKCVWCNKQSDKLKETSVLSTGLPAGKQHEIIYFVCPEHETLLRKFYDRVRWQALLFLGLIAIFLLGMIIPSGYTDHYWSQYVFVLSFSSIGLVLIIFPFCTPQTISMMGVAKSIIIARVIGGVFFTLGIIGFVLALLD